jgi:hypothetical protein
MPVDFNRVPPLTAVPDPPQLSTIAWTILLVLTLAAGAGLTILLWPASRSPNTPWFWFCMTGYPSLAWAFLLCSRLGYGYVRHNEAIATNSISEEAKEACHILARKPLAILGYAWCFSTKDADNAFDGIRNGSTKLEGRPGASGVAGEVAARWLEVSDTRFDAGNELDEHVRHRAICTWLLAYFTSRLAPQLNALPSRTKVQVEICLRSKVKAAASEDPLRDLLRARTTVEAGDLDIQPTGTPISIFETDAWLDGNDVNKAYLLIAIELRDAVSTVLSDNVAETGVALLVGHPNLLPSPLRSTATRLHRPAKGDLGAIRETLELATSWGGLPPNNLMRTVWAHGLTVEQTTAVKQAANLTDDTNWMTLETSVGDCESAGPWLAAAFAAENARTTGEPQLVLSRQDDQLVALVCK